MSVTGLRHMHQQSDHALRMLCFAADIIERAARVTLPGASHPVQVRVGLASGPVAAGIMGRIRRKYTVMGSTVNLASRMESTGEAGAIHLTAEAARATGIPLRYFQERTVAVKGLGTLTTYLIDPRALHVVLEATVAGSDLEPRRPPRFQSATARCLDPTRDPRAGDRRARGPLSASLTA
jgi:class 3 adenylate cyclase